MDLVGKTDASRSGNAASGMSGEPTPYASPRCMTEQVGDVRTVWREPAAADPDDGHRTAPAPVAAMLVHNGE